MKFTYTRFGIFYKPVVPVVFKFDDESITYQALVDTGSDVCIIHAEIAQQLGIILKDGLAREFGGICGQGLGYIHTVDLSIGGNSINNVPVMFSHDIAPHGFGVLGHEGLFDRLKLNFEFGKKQFEIIPKTYNK